MKCDMAITEGIDDMKYERRWNLNLGLEEMITTAARVYWGFSES